MEITVVPSDYIKWAFDELDKPLESYIYRSLGQYPEAIKCWCTPLEYNYLLTDSSDLILDRTRTLAGYLRSCIIPRKVLKTLVYTNSSVTLKGEEALDIWKAYYKNGKGFRTKAKIVFEDFDESKLV